MIKPVRLLVISLFILLVSALPARAQVYLDSTATPEARAQDLLSRMTLEEKVGQMTQADLGALGNRNDVTAYFLGSVLSGGGSDPSDNSALTWTETYDAFQQKALATRLKIPIIYGVDAVHGHNNVFNAVIFPHNIGLGCTRNADLVEKTGRITAMEVAATGIDWTFAPCVAVPRDERWGRTYEGFSENPELVKELGAASIRGLQGDSLSHPATILACAKHYVADGGTERGRDQGNSVMDEEELRVIHLPGYISAIENNVGSVMASFSSWNGQKMHGHKYLLTDVLKGELGFEGFVVSDWAGIDQLPGDYSDKVEKSINAGIDMVMVPNEYVNFITTLKSLVNNGRVTQARIDDAVLRILKIKFELGLFEHPMAERSFLKYLGSEEHRAVARQAVRESLVLLKKKDGILPLPESEARILVAGRHASNIGLQCGGWSIDWQGRSGNITKGTTILEGFRKAATGATIEYSTNGNFSDPEADYAVVVIGEEPYAEGYGDREDLNLSAEDVALVKKMKEAGNKVIVILISGRPMIIKKIEHYADVIAAAWLPGTEGDGIADILFGDYQPTGKLSFSWPNKMEDIPVNVGDTDYSPLYPYGHGILSLEDSPSGSAPVLMSSVITPEGSEIELTFNKAMALTTTPVYNFVLTRNGESFTPGITVSLKEGDATTLLLTLDTPYKVWESATIEYISGNLFSRDAGVLKPFGPLEIYSLVSTQAVQIPAFIEAENYSGMSGVQQELTSDEGGGYNLSSIDNGDWVEYNISVPAADLYLVGIRAAAATAGRINLTSDGTSIGVRTVPATGSGQSWITVSQLVQLEAGSHTLRLTAETGGYNLNWINITSLSSVENDPDIPRNYFVSSNYPNPFNPSTRIDFSIPEAGYVNLSVYNQLGEKVAELVNGYKPAGVYSVDFDASEYSSGMYVYRFTAGGFGYSGKMLLLK